MQTFFTGDTHWFHTNILRYCNRPFKDVGEMNETLIENWNRVVRPKDQVFHLGDFAFCSPDKAANIARRLHGKKYLILGNHDRKKTVEAIRPFFEWIKDVYMLTIQDNTTKHGNQQIWLSHYCHLVWPQQGYGVFHLFAHSHGNCAVPFASKAMDVGVDCWNYEPVRYDMIKLHMSQRNGQKGI